MYLFLAFSCYFTWHIEFELKNWKLWQKFVTSDCTLFSNQNQHFLKKMKLFPCCNFPLSCMLYFDSLLDNASNYLLVGCVIQFSPHFLPYVSPSCTLYYNFANAQTWVGNKNWRPSKYLWFYSVKSPTL